MLGLLDALGLLGELELLGGLGLLGELGLGMDGVEGGDCCCDWHPASTSRVTPAMATQLARIDLFMAHPQYPGSTRGGANNMGLMVDAAPLQVNA